MADKHSKLSLEEVQSLLDYNPETGVFRWKVSHVNKVCEGSVAGHYAKLGYVQLRIDGVMYQAHRLAWFMCYGKWPEHNIDHINGDGLDNRIVNLRDVPQKLNLRNCRARTDNTSGVTGVSWDKGKSKWAVRIYADGKSLFLGRFAEFEDAVKARKDAEPKYGFTERHGKKLYEWVD